MNKQQKERLVRHLDFLQEEIGDYTLFKSITWKIYDNDKSKRRELERWIENLVNSCIDISKLILTAEGKRLPETYKEIVQHATLVLGFTEEEVNSLSQLVILRNIVAHEYLDIRWASIKRFLEEAGPLYKNFSEKVKEYLKKRLQA